MLNLIIPVKGFEEIKITDERGDEFWYARDLCEILGYSRWEKFQELLARAKKACFISNQNMENHFHQVVKMVQIGSGVMREIKDVKLSRYACYLVAQNGDPTKMPQVAVAQTYFAIQTRKQEIQEMEELEKMTKRVAVREEVKHGNKSLFSTARKSGVSNFGSFNDAGYRGLYGMSLSEVEKVKGVKKGELLDRAGRAELAANLFRITQTEDRLITENVKNQDKANQIHNMVGGKVRQTIKDIGGKMPETLKTEKHIKLVKKEIKSLKTTIKRIK